MSVKTKNKLKVLLVRASKTFVQGFIGSFSAGLLLFNATGGVSALRALAVASIAAGVSALMNLYLKPTEAK